MSNYLTKSIWLFIFSATLNSIVVSHRYYEPDSDYYTDSEDRYNRDMDSADDRRGPIFEDRYNRRRHDRYDRRHPEFDERYAERGPGSHDRHVIKGPVNYDSLWYRLDGRPTISRHHQTVHIHHSKKVYIDEEPADGQIHHGKITSGQFQDDIKHIFNEWHKFKNTHSKQYSDKSEEDFRKSAYLDNKRKVEEHNRMHRKGHKSFALEINHLSDMTPQEIAKLMNGHISDDERKTPRHMHGSTHVTPNNVIIPQSIDWREKGYVTEVKNQGQCGSCYTFTTTGSLEGQHFRKTGQLISLSEQNIIDCSQSYGNKGCDGGNANFAFTYIKENEGIATQQSYPYEEKQGECRFSQGGVGATDTGHVSIPKGDEKTLMEAVATIGPIAVAIDASLHSFQFYSKGVYDDEECSQKLDHGVLIVGYGTDEETGKDYWLVKNSWGTVWGDEGYIKMARNENNKCGIASQASYPLV